MLQSSHNNINFQNIDNDDDDDDDDIKENYDIMPASRIEKSNVTGCDEGNYNNKQSTIKMKRRRKLYTYKSINKLFTN
jgi:hypothetical protein